MAYIMAKRGEHDNIVTYEHYCDYVIDLNDIPKEYSTLGSIAVVVHGEGDQLEVYIADTDGKWNALAINSSGSDDIITHICTESEYDAETLIPIIENPVENVFYFVPNNESYNVWIYKDQEWQQLNGGGGGEESKSVASKAVNFRDYDGTIVASYTADEFAALTAMPANPDHTSDNLTAQGWNWSLEDAKAYVAKYGALEVGQMYITTDGKTHIQIHLKKGRTSPVLGVGVNGTVDVDWGDGTAHDTLTGTAVGTTQWTPNHTYAAPGDYDIALTVTGKIQISGDSDAGLNTRLLRYSSDAQTDYRNDVYQAAIQSIQIGENVDFWDNTFRNCVTLRNIMIPNSVTGLGTGSFSGCNSLSSITIPDSVTSIRANSFNSCGSLNTITIPDGVTSIGHYAFSSCAALSNITIPDGVTSIGVQSFRNCYTLSTITIPDGVTNIETYAFSTCRSMAEYHVLPTTPPTLGASAFANYFPPDCIIYVPYSADHSILKAYKAATNWSAYASYMQEEPQS